MGLMQEIAISVGDISRGAFCVVNNLVNPNKAHVMRTVQFHSAVTKVQSLDGKTLSTFLSSHRPPGPRSKLEAHFAKPVIVTYQKARKEVKWEIVFTRQK